MKLLSRFLLVIILLTSCSVPEKQPKPIDDKKEDISTTEEIHSVKLPENANHGDWNLILVNPAQALPANYEVELTEVDYGEKVDSRIAADWAQWKEAALLEGHSLFLASAYRSQSTQETNFNQSLKKYRDQGLTEEEALRKTKEYLTEPGHSEHHTGLALDIVDEEWINSGKGLIPEYDQEASQKWLVSSMADYGFILRYPEGKEEITEINYEPWHFRYVGKGNARFIVDNELTLEEYVDLLQQENS